METPSLLITAMERLIVIPAREYNFCWVKTCHAEPIIVSDSNSGRNKQFFAAYAKRVPQTIIYVDFVRGDDTTGDGTALKPLATIDPDISTNVCLPE